MPLFPTTFASPVVLQQPAEPDGLVDVSLTKVDSAQHDASQGVISPQGDRNKGQHVDRDLNVVQAAVVGSILRATQVGSTGSTASSPVLASSRRSSQHDRSSGTSISHGGSSSNPASRPSSYTSSLASAPELVNNGPAADTLPARRKSHSNSPLVHQLARRDSNDDDKDYPAFERARAARHSTGVLARSSTGTSSRSPVLDSSNVHAPRKHGSSRKQQQQPQGLGFDMRVAGFNWTRDLVQVDNSDGDAHATYSSDLGSGVSSQSSPDTSPSAPAVQDPAVDRLHPTSHRKQRAHFLEHQIEHHERITSDRSPTTDLEPEHIVFDTPALATKSARDRSRRRSNNNASVSSASSPALSSSSPVVARRASASSARSSSNIDQSSPVAVTRRQSKVYFPPPPAHISPRPAPVFSFIKRSTENDQAVTAKLAANGPFPPAPRPLRSSLSSSTSAAMMKSRSASSFDHAPVFPTASSPRVVQQQRRRYSALEPVTTWDAQDGDELDWMMEASARTVENHPTRALMDHEQRTSQRDGTTLFGECEVDERDGDEGGHDSVVDEVLGGGTVKSKSLDRTRDDCQTLDARYDITPETIAALAPVAQGNDKDVALQQWVLDQIATNAVGENWRRMSAIGEETDEEDDDGGKRQNKNADTPKSLTRNVKGLNVITANVEDTVAVAESSLVEPSLTNVEALTPVSPSFATAPNSPLPKVSTTPRSPSSRPPSIASQSSVRSRLSGRFLNLTNFFGGGGGIQKSSSSTSRSDGSVLKPQGISSDSVRHLMTSSNDGVVEYDDVEELATTTSYSQQRQPRSSTSLRSQPSSSSSAAALPQHDSTNPSADKEMFSCLLDKFQIENEDRLRLIALNKVRQRQEKLEKRRGSLERADELMLIEESIRNGHSSHQSLSSSRRGSLERI
ncbi:hypothetical protein ACM66B_001236 [Microbotryomycetes sp. NB124-2]